MKVIIECSRCHEIVKGYHSGIATAGFYDVTSDWWKRFARVGEINLCQICMWNDPAYQNEYGVQFGVKDNRLK